MFRIVNLLHLNHITKRLLTKHSPVVSVFIETEKVNFELPKLLGIHNWNFYGKISNINLKMILFDHSYWLDWSLKGHIYIETESIINIHIFVIDGVLTVIAHDSNDKDLSES